MSAVDICNEALIAIGESPNIESIAPPDGSAHAQLCAKLYQSAVEFVTESRHWTFADRRALLAKPRIAVLSVDAASDNITTASAHGCETDDQLTFVRATAGAGTAPGGLTFDETYYAINGGATTLRLSATEGGSAIDITSTGGGSFVLERESDRPGVSMFALPTDCLVERFVLPPGVPDDWAMRGNGSMPVGDWAGSYNGLNYSHECESGFGPVRNIAARRAVNKAGESVIYTELGEADLLYSKAITDTAQWPMQFRQAVVWQLAAGLAGGIKRDIKLVDWCLARAQAAISEASRVDASRVTMRERRAYPWSRG